MEKEKQSRSNNNEKSELEMLLEKNAYGEGLSRKEALRAKYLIMTAIPTDQECWVCKMYDKESADKAIYDTGLCKSHAFYALITRK